MVTNLNSGPIQVFDNTVPSINVAFAQILEAIDQQRGLRGRSFIYDRVRVDSPADDSDAVDLQSLITQEYRWRLSFLWWPTFGFPGGTTYVELGSLHRQPVDFQELTEPEARMIVTGRGTEAGTGKGVAMMNSAGQVLTEVTWDGNAESIYVGAFTPIAETTDQQVQIHIKGSSPTESIAMSAAIVEFKGSIQTVQT